MKTVDQILNSSEFNIALGRMIERLDLMQQNHADWRNIYDDCFEFEFEMDNVTVTIELTPEWTNLEELNAENDKDLYNEYYNNSLETEPDYTLMDIKVRVLDYTSMTDKTIYSYTVFYNGEYEKNIF